MKIIVENSTKLAKYQLPDTDTIADNGFIEVRGSKDFNIGDLTMAGVTIYENVTDAPADWIGNKYLYDGAWTPNSDYVDPEVEKDEEIASLKAEVADLRAQLKSFE